MEDNGFDVAAGRGGVCGWGRGRSNGYGKWRGKKGDDKGKGERKVVTKGGRISGMAKRGGNKGVKRGNRK